MMKTGTQTIVILSTLFVLGVFGLIWYISSLQNAIIKSSALESANLYSSALSEFRTIYTSEVVSRIEPHPDFEVTHDYKNKENAIPLPATLSMELGNQIGKHLSGAEAHLYSAYPFPWREKEGGIREKFRKEAWEFLNINPDKPFYKFTQYKGRSVVRYATADLMRPSCVSCHNNHPQTPKNNWKVNDVRGVLEIIHPMEKVIEQTRSGTRGMFFFAAAVTIFGLACLFSLITHFRKTTHELEIRVAARTKEVHLANEQLVEAKKMAALGEISASMAHEINQPLGAIQLSAETLNNSVIKKQYGKTTKYTERIINQAQRINDIISQLSIFSKGVKLKKDDFVDINELIMRIANSEKEKFETENIRLEQELSEGLPSIKCNLIEIERVLINLLLNARQALESNTGKKKVVIRSYQNGDNVGIEVSDNGPGVPDEIKNKIFEPFFSSKPIGKGTGLGLSICYGIIKDHDGELFFESEPGKGTSFQVVFHKSILKKELNS